jgi:hypothetical protein
MILVIPVLNMQNFLLMTIKFLWLVFEYKTGFRMKRYPIFYVILITFRYFINLSAK